MYRLKLKATAAHALFHVCQRVDTLLKELDLLDLHQISVQCVNMHFTHDRKAACHDAELERALHTILEQLPDRVAELPHLSEWETHLRAGLEMELAGLLHQGLGLILAYRVLPETMEEVLPDLPFIHTAEGVLGVDVHDPKHDWLARACDWKPGEGPWG